MKRSVPLKSVSNEPRVTLGSQKFDENARKGGFLAESAENKKSKVGNLKMFWENRKSDDITTPNFVGPMGVVQYRRKNVIANHTDSPGFRD